MLAAGEQNGPTLWRSRWCDGPSPPCRRWLRCKVAWVKSAVPQTSRAGGLLDATSSFALFTGCVASLVRRKRRLCALKRASRGHLSALGDETEDAELAARVETLQGKLGEEHPFHSNAGALRRFLIARNLDVGAALEMLNAHMEWRAANLPIVLTPEIKAELRKGKFYVLPEAKDVNGNPVVVVRSGLFDPKERDLDATIKAFIFLLEESLGNLDETGKFSVLYDRDGFSLTKNFDFDLLKSWAQIASDNYPERLASVALYPSGTVLAGLFKLVSPFFAPRTREKIKMVQNEEELQTIIPSDALPPRYGGSCSYEFDPAIYTT